MQIWKRLGAKPLRRRSPRSRRRHSAWHLAKDFGSAIHAAVDDGDIAAHEAPLLVRSLLSAGLDTTVASLGAALHCLARFPEQFQRLRAEPALARAAFEEAIRLESPVQHFFRTSTCAADIGDTKIGEGEKISINVRCCQPRPAALGTPGHIRHNTQ